MALIIQELTFTAEKGEQLKFLSIWLIDAHWHRLVQSMQRLPL